MLATTSQSRVVGKITTQVSTIPASQTAISSLPPTPRKVVLLNSKSPLSGSRRFNLQSSLLGGKTKSKTGSNLVDIKSVTNKIEQDGMVSKLDTETDVKSSTQSSVEGVLQELIPKKVILLKSILGTVPTQVPITRVSTPGVSTTSEPDSSTTLSTTIVSSNTSVHEETENRRVVLLKSFKNLFKSPENITMTNEEKNEDSETNASNIKSIKTEAESSMLPSEVLPQEPISKKVVLLKSFLFTTPTQEPHTRVSTLSVSTSSKPETDTTPVPVMVISSSKPIVPSQNRRIVLLKSFSNLLKSSENTTKFESATVISNVEKGNESKSDKSVSVTQAAKTEEDNLPGKVLPEEKVSKKVVLLKSFRVTAPTHEPHTRVSTRLVSTKSQPDTITPVPATTVSSDTSEDQSQNRRVVVLKSFANHFKSPGVTVKTLNSQSSPENMTRLESDDIMSDTEEGKDSELEVSKASNL